MSATWLTRNCGTCGQAYETLKPFSRICPACRKRNKNNGDRRRKNGIGQGPRKVERRLPTTGLPSGRDARLNQEQRRRDRDLDERLYADCGTSPVTVYRPGEPGFEEVARTVTPVTKIPHREPMEWVEKRWYLENEGFPVRSGTGDGGLGTGIQ